MAENHTDKSFWTAQDTKLVFINADMVLAFPINLSPDSNGNVIGTIGEVCANQGFMSVICSGPQAKTRLVNQGPYSFNVTTNSSTDVPFTEFDVENLAVDNFFFLTEFASAFVRMTTVGYDIAGISEFGLPLGVLTPFDYNTCNIVASPVASPVSAPTISTDDDT